MITKYQRVNALYPNIMVLKCAAEIIQEGGVVAFPTETVYGLGADGFNEDALEKIFIAKGRPMDNPLILHIASSREIVDVASYISARAKKAITAFWPGPLTLVLPKNPQVPDQVSAGLSTVAVRMPAHPIALKLIKLARVPVAAPSANLSGRPSPTTGFHVLKDLKGKIDMIVDGGPCRWGIESTVVDFTDEIPTILRPGAVTREMLESVVGQVIYDPGLKNKQVVPKSPGVKYLHYAPRGDMYLIQGDNSQLIVAKLKELIQSYKGNGKRVALIATNEIIGMIDDLKLDFNLDYIGNLGSKYEQELIASRVYHLLRNCDRFNIDIILTEGLSEEGLGAAIMNRLLKASGNKVIKA
ncbi:L-threonylcarbamoyladenylate synthase [Desulfitibacter alkalitolerans]|uniref:L-threonylcarbamoyladenylate synthase n=1 Tax=Desulfitibacter alkalitolerans TaxID=264641 RepID=UPI0005500B77|nr:L-threonylcarbamoyladenylate synthase [Desulfitibacter alkalitolerans]